ncbi:Protein RRP5 -like protein [Halotydeus destructor]|nr:Protein RRP5 -like protein [Halotydeus destructor]
MTKGEVDFPRGGFPSTGQSVTKKRKSASDELFRVHKRADEVEESTKKTRKKKKKSGDVAEDAVVIEPITLENLTVGMVVMGSVYKVSDYDIKVIVPGGTMVIVPIFNISDSYSELVEQFMADTSSKLKPLKPQSMFKAGQCFPVKIVEKDSTEDPNLMIKIVGSFNPKDVYANLLASNVVEFIDKLQLSCAVVSVEDHGYLMDIGLGKNLTGFLSREDAKHYLQKSALNRTELAVGMLLMCAGVSASGRVIRLTTETTSFKKNKITGDETNIALATIVPGTRVSLTVMDVSEKGLEIVVANEYAGYVNREHLKSEWDLPKTNYSIGDVFDGVVLCRKPVTNHVICSLRDLPEPETIGLLSSVHVGHLLDKATVLSKDGAGNLILKAKEFKLFAPKTQLSDTFADASDVSLENKYLPGSEHKCRVKIISYIDNFMRVTLKPSIVDLESIALDDVKVGSVLKGKVVRLIKAGLVLQLGYRLRAFVPTIHLSDTALKHPEKMFPLHKEVICRVKKVDTSVDPPKIAATCKKSLMSHKAKILSSYSEVQNGMEVTGVIVLVTDTGMLIDFFDNVKGWVPAKFVSEFKADNRNVNFQIGQTLSCWVHSKYKNGRFTLSLRPQQTEPKLAEGLSERTVSESSEQVDDDVTGVEVKLSGALKKRNRKLSEAIEEKHDDLKVDESEDVKKKSWKRQKRRKVSEPTEEQQSVVDVNVSDGESVTIEEQHDDLEVNESEDVKKKSRKRQKRRNGAEPTEEQQGVIDVNVSDGEKSPERTKDTKESETTEERQDVVFVSKKRAKSKKKNMLEKEPEDVKPLGFDAFVWDSEAATKALELLGTTVKEEKTDDSVTTIQERSERKSKKEKNADAREKEAELRKAENQLADRSRLPETMADYERLVLASPNSSLVWLQYISFLVEQSEIDKARQVAEKALKTISFREENEKLNIWVTYLNLEHMYGSADSVDELFNRALQVNDQLKVYTHMANMYFNSEKAEAAEQMYEIMLKKFKGDKDVWINYGLFNMKLNRLEMARKLMQRSLRALDKRHHIDVISKFAQMEFKTGEAERGKTLFESMLINYPKRTDLWSIYIDMLIKYTVKGSEKEVEQSLEAIRTVFERVVNLKMAVKRMKALFSKYIDFESKYGTESSVNKVRKMADDYVEPTPMLSH